MTKQIIWGNGCNLCGGTGEEWLDVSGGDGWAGRPCPHCVPGGDLYDDREPPEGEEGDTPPVAPVRLPQPWQNAILQQPVQCQVEADGDMVWA